MFNEDYYRKLLVKLSFPKEVIEQFLCEVECHEKSIMKKAARAYEGEAPKYPVCEERPWIRLCVILYKLREVEDAFQKLGITEAIFIDTCKDITLRYQLYLHKYHKAGLSKADALWFRHIFHIHIFKIGVLQFQLFHMVYLDKAYLGYDYMVYAQEQYAKLPPNTDVINVHVQKGADLDTDKVIASFAQAEEFFKLYFPQFHPKAFVCYSWLLHEHNQQFLKADSRILGFAKQFEIIAQNDSNYEAIKRIYGKHCRTISEYAQTTSLQRNALHHFKELGEACGIRYLKK